jgi:hypothetical protein
VVLTPCLSLSIGLALVWLLSSLHMYVDGWVHLIVLVSVALSLRVQLT